MVGRMAITYSDAREQHALYLRVVNRVTQIGNRLQRSLLDLRAYQYNLKQRRKRLTIACSDSRALYTRGRTSKAHVNQTS